MLHIRKATLEDIDTLIKVGSQAFLETFAEHNTEADMQTYLSTKFTQEQFKGEFNEPNVTFFIAEYENQVAGYAKLTLCEQTISTLVYQKCQFFDHLFARLQDQNSPFHSYTIKVLCRAPF